METRYLEGATIPEIADELDRSCSVVGRQIKALGISRRMGPPPKYPPPTRATCRHCGGPITFSSPYYASGSRGQFCSRECFIEQVKRGDVISCPECGRERYRARSHAHKECCSRSCGMKRRFRRGVGLGKAWIESRTDRGRWGTRARQRWLGRWGGPTPPGPGAQPRGRPLVEVHADVEHLVRHLARLGVGRRKIHASVRVREERTNGRRVLVLALKDGDQRLSERVIRSILNA
jgi:hypothetical protein